MQREVMHQPLQCSNAFSSNGSEGTRYCYEYSGPYHRWSASELRTRNLVSCDSRTPGRRCTLVLGPSQRTGPGARRLPQNSLPRADGVSVSAASLRCQTTYPSPSRFRLSLQSIRMSFRAAIEYDFTSASYNCFDHERLSAE
jgi:hypothetical protein